MEEMMFEAYGCLGYFKNYAEKAQKMMEKNNQINKEYENALILRNLGDFSESNNGDGTELYYSSFLLYIVRADKQISYGFVERAERDLNHAK
jgi:Holliday junction resolvasome RuvABC DNA-binding subunit